MKSERIDELKENGYGNFLNAIPNTLGINLCSVDDIIVEKQNDGQLTSINIKFIPA